MRVWAFKIREGDMLGRFHVKRDFKIYVDWRPNAIQKERWSVTVSLWGVRETGTGPTCASALIALYTLVSENYASIREYQEFLQASCMIRRRI